LRAQDNRVQGLGFSVYSRQHVSSFTEETLSNGSNVCRVLRPGPSRLFVLFHLNNHCLNRTPANKRVTSSHSRTLEHPFCMWGFKGLHRVGHVHHIQGYLAHKNPLPPQDPTVALCLGTYGSPRGGAVSYERGTPVRGCTELVTFLT